jgi:hypothetical protein
VRDVEDPAAPPTNLRRRHAGAADPQRSDHVKYMLLIYANPAVTESLAEGELDVLMREAGSIMEELRTSGEWVAGQGLAEPARTRTVRVRGGAPAITDGPYLEAKEYLAGVCLFDCASEERALEVAARWPDARYTGVELRPVVGEA